MRRARRAYGSSNVLPAIFAVIGLIGLGASVVSAAKKTPEAKERIEKAEEEKGEELTTVETVKAAAPAYVETAIFVIITGASIIAAGRCHYKAVTSGAAATGLAAMYHSRLKKTESAVKEQYGDEALDKVKKEARKKEVREVAVGTRTTAPSAKQIRDWYFEDHHDGMFDVYEPFTKQWIKTSRMHLTCAILRVNRLLMGHYGAATLDDFVIALGGKSTKRGKEIGWSLNNEIQDYNWGYYGGPWVDPYIDITNMDGEDVLAIFYDVEPMEDADFSVTEMNV